MKATTAINRFRAFVLLFILCAPAGRALVVPLQPTADTFITAGTTNGASSATNYGGLGAISVAGSLSGNGGEYLALFKFDLASAVTQFDAAFGASNWSINAVTLQLASNVGTQGGVPNNPRFPVVNGGPFSALWFSDDSWTETGVTYNNFTAGTTESLGSFDYVPPGNDIALVWSLGLGTNFLTDLATGGAVSLQLAPGNDTVSYLFNSRTFTTPANRPVLSVSAVPEPSSVLLLVIGTAVAAYVHRRRMRAVR